MARCKNVNGSVTAINGPLPFVFLVFLVFFFGRKIDFLAFFDDLYSQKYSQK